MIRHGGVSLTATAKNVLFRGERVQMSVEVKAAKYGTAFLKAIEAFVTKSPP